MEMVRTEFDMSGIDSVLNQMGKRVESFPMEILATGLEGAVDDVIQSEGFGEWMPLSQATIRINPKRKGGKLLQDTGQLGNMQPSFGADYAEVTSPAPYAGYHIEGTRWMPARDWTAVDMDTVLEEFTMMVLNGAVQ